MVLSPPVAMYRPFVDTLMALQPERWMWEACEEVPYRVNYTILNGQHYRCGLLACHNICGLPVSCVSANIYVNYYCQGGIL